MTFMQKLIETWQKAFHFNPEMLNLSQLEMEKLNYFFYANLLMVECKKSAVRVLPEVWEGIELRMLLPVKNNQ
ncbi:MAG: hypothetical protein AB4368_20395 [Xenococcaceae cyanobacterium]